MEEWWNDTGREKLMYFKKPVPVPHGRVWDGQNLSAFYTTRTSK
jgi:hypothetical protein